MSELYIIRAKVIRPGDAPAICYRFTEAGAAAVIEQLRSEGREAYIERGERRCGWGAAYESTHCRNSATYYDDGIASWLCDEHAAISGWPRLRSFAECAEAEMVKLAREEEKQRGGNVQARFIE